MRSGEMLALAPVVRAYVWALSAGAPQTDSLAHRALLQAWRGRDALDGTKALKLAALRVAHTVWRDAPADHGSHAAERRAAIAVRGPRNRFGALLERLALLPEADREALWLVAGADLTYAEAAFVCGCTREAIGLRAAQARARLCEAGPLLNPPPRRPTAALPPPDGGFERYAGRRSAGGRPAARRS